MNIIKGLQEEIQHFWEGVVRIFSPSDDEYPESGVQPYEGEPYEEHRHENR